MRQLGSALASVAIGLAWVGHAWAGLSLSPLILDLPSTQPSRGDIEVVNTGSDKLYVLVEPARIDNPGKPDEHRVQSPDPAAVGLVAAPGRMVLEPGQRKFIRLSVLDPPGEQDRIFRVSVKPVVGAASGEATGLKVLVGYDMLVIQRPRDAHAAVVSAADPEALTLTNTGNTNVELFRGRECPAGGGSCKELPSTRLYAGAHLRISHAPGAHIIYTVKTGGEVREQSF